MNEVGQPTALVLALGEQQRKVTLPEEPCAWDRWETPSARGKSVVPVARVARPPQIHFPCHHSHACTKQ